MQNNIQNKNHHYVSQFYLRYFSCDDKKKMINTIVKNTGELWQNKIHKVAYEKNYNTITKHGVLDKSFDVMVTHIEDIIAPEYEKEHNKILKTTDLSNMCHDDIENIIAYIGLLYANSPKIRSLLQYTCIELDKMISTPTDKNYTKLQSMKSGKDIYEILTTEIYKKQVHIIRNDYDIFITSDSPVILHDRNPNPHRGTPLTNKDVLFPVSPKVMLIFTNNTIEYYSISIVCDIICNHATDKIFSSYDIYKQER